MDTNAIFDEASATVDFPLSDTDSTLLPSEPEPVTKTVDPFTVSEDGHYIGNDGFIVPKDFQEFHERFPNRVVNFVRNWLPYATEPDIQDRVSELNIHLMSVPVESIYRTPGYNGRPEGCTDRIQVFSPLSGYGASGRRFFNYVYHCLKNASNSLSKKACSNPIRRASTLGLDGTDPDTNQVVDEEFLYRMADPGFRARHPSSSLETRIFVHEFLGFVKEYNPDLLPVIGMIARSATYVEAQRQLGMGDQLFLRARNRIDVLRENFLKAKTPPRQRKVYRSRKSSAAAITDSATV